jgi:hypothetical protein
MTVLIHNSTQLLSIGTQPLCKVAREVVGGPRGPIVIIVEVIQCKVDEDNAFIRGMECKVAREVVGGPRGPIVIIVEVIQCKVD